MKRHSHVGSVHEAVTLPIPSMVISMPRSRIQVTTRSRPSLSTSVNV